ncbi:hypothetical protein ACQZ42_32255 [Rhizobium rhizogenes]
MKRTDASISVTVIERDPTS